MGTDFKDHFSVQASLYQQFRPVYPGALFKYLGALSPSSQLAWDCACGSGQAAQGLSPFFEYIRATDASASQIEHATGAANVSFERSTAEQSSFKDGSVDLVAVAQAFHWFEHPAFFMEVKRVLKPKGVLALWTYNLSGVDPVIDGLVNHFYESVIGPYWPPERKMVENAYKDIDFPFSKVERLKAFEMSSSWSLNQYLGYISTWSAVQSYKKNCERDPMEGLYAQLTKVWGEDDFKNITWPLTLITCVDR